MLTLLGIAALIILVLAGLLVLRINNDPQQSDAVRSYLAETKQKPEEGNSPSQQSDPKD